MLGFIGGLFLGTALGMFMMALIQVTKEDKDD